MTEAVAHKSFSYLSERKKERISDHAKGMWIIYEEYIMSEYLCPHGEDISIEERKWIFRCRVDYLDVKANRTWMYQDISCSSCLQNIDETQYPILNCEYLLGKNEHLTYISDYMELYNGELKEQIYVSRIMKENYTRRIST